MKFLEVANRLLHPHQEPFSHVREALKHTETRINPHNRAFRVQYYMNPAGYTRSDCQTCHTTAIWRLQIHNHVEEPIHSEYYCNAHVPETIQPTSE